MILNKETYNLIKEQGKIDNKGAKFSYIPDDRNFYANNNDEIYFIKKNHQKIIILF